MAVAVVADTDPGPVVVARALGAPAGAVPVPGRGGQAVGGGVGTEGGCVCYCFGSAVSPQTYQQSKIGDTRDRVHELIGGDSMTARKAGRAGQPAAPSGTTCDYALAEGFGSVFRFCFNGAKPARNIEIRTP